MIPRKVDSFYPELASEIGVSVEAVSDAVSFFWKEIKKQLDEPEYINIGVEYFGTFEVRKKQALYMIEKYKRIIKYMKPNTYSKHAMMDKASKALEKLEKMVKLIEEQEKKKQQVRQIQKNGKTV